MTPHQSDVVHIDGDGALWHGGQSTGAGVVRAAVAKVQRVVARVLYRFGGVVLRVVLQQRVCLEGQVGDCVPQRGVSRPRPAHSEAGLSGALYTYIMGGWRGGGGGVRVILIVIF